MAKATVAGQELCVLVHALARAKEEEHRCEKERLAIEQRIIECVGFFRPEGSQTYEATDDHGCTVRVRLDQPLYRRINAERWEAVKARVPEELRPVRYVPDVVTAGVRWLQENRPDVWMVVSEAITTQPGKVSVTVVEA